MPRHFYLLLAFTLSTVSASAQKGSSLTVYTVYPAGGSFHGPLLIGGSRELHVSNAFMAGADYGYGLTPWLSLHAGIEYSQYKVTGRYTSDEPPITQTTQQLGYADLFSIPVTARFVFLKYAFLQTGLLWDTQLHNEAYSESKTGQLTLQSGLGALLNLGLTLPLCPHSSLSAAFSNEYHGLHLTSPNAYDQKLFAYGFRVSLTRTF